MNRWRVGEDRGSKETDGCPLTLSWFGSLGRWEVEAHVELSVKVIIEVGIFTFEVLCRIKCTPQGD
jgi:hypothetical protein